MDMYKHVLYQASRYLTSLGTSVFGLGFDFNTRNESFDLRGGGVRFSLNLFSLLLLRLCIDIKLHANAGTSKKVCGGWWWWVVVVICQFSVLLWSKPFYLKLKIWIWTKPNNMFAWQ